MRNLKKILALVLALVMSLSLVTMANADYSDAAAIDNDEAVAVMSALGVLQGSDGKFDPDAILTREQAAKIITYMLMGKEKADKLTTVIAPFSDVEATRWSAGSIAYCADQGILDGIGGGKFAPTAKLTGLQFAKMVLCALGYDSAIEGLTGETFAIKAATLAVELGLDKNVSGDLSAELSRENAAQMAFNALEQDTVFYQGGTTIDLPGGTSVTVGATKYTSAKFMTKYFKDLAKDEDNIAADKYGRPSAYEWELDGEVVYTAPIKAVATYVNAWDKDAKEALEDKEYTIADKVVYNGKSGYGVPALADLMAGDKAVNGYTVELYDTTDDKTKNVDIVVVIEEYFAKVGKFTAAKGDTPASVKLTVYENAFSAGKELTITDDAKKTDDAYDMIAAYAEGDYVAVVMEPKWELGTGKLLSIAALQSVEGKVAKYTKGTYRCTSTVTVAGAAYGINNEAVTVPTTAGSEGTFYLDAQGKIIGFVGKAAAETNDTAIIVTDVYNTLEDSKLVTKVTGMNSKGETITLTLKKGATAPTAWTVCEYTEDADTKGIYTFAAATTGTIADDDTVKTSITIDKKTKKLGEVFFASDLKFFFVDDEKIVVKEGAQEYTGDAFVVANKVDEKLYATAIIVLAPESDGNVTSDDIIFVAKKTGEINVLVDDTATTFYTYDAYVNGVLVEDFFSEDDSVAAGFYKSIKAEKTGAYDLSTAYSASTGKTAVVEDVNVDAIANNIMTAGSPAVDYDVASATVVDLTAAAEGIVANVDAYVVYDADTNVASYVYIAD